MNYQNYKKFVREIKFGKNLPDAIYIHQSAISAIPQELATYLTLTAKHLKITNKNWNIVKFYKSDHKFSLLNYPAFDTYAYPSLQESYTVNLETLTARKASFKKSTNPPILHRKELFILQSHRSYTQFKEITQEGEEIGLYKNTKSIGFKNNWERIIRIKGYTLDESGRLEQQPIVHAHQPTNDATETIIERHKTAIDRRKLSSPMQILARHGYLDGQHSILDYGCGKGDDIAELEAHGIDCVGWDPTYKPNTARVTSNIVNLGFVLNVIEDSLERQDTLKAAYSYAQSFLISSVMVAGESVTRLYEPYKDGVITSINTFQKYYAQSEIRGYIERVLNENVIAVGQGIFIVFRDKLAEQQFLIDRQHINRNWTQRTEKALPKISKQVRQTVIEKNQILFDEFWATTLDLGRLPANNEFEHSDQIRHLVGSHKTAFDTICTLGNETIFDEAQQARKDDLLVYFALGLFERRKPYKHMPDGLKRDIKSFFGNKSEADKAAQSLLFSVGKPSVIQEACESAYAQIGCGEYTEGHSFTFHKDYLGAMPAVLRIYIGCATQLYGDLEDIHLIKAHIRSGKVSLMKYLNWNEDIPMLIERVKIKLREQDIDFFDYVGEFEPTALENKFAFLGH